MKRVTVLIMAFVILALMQGSSSALDKESLKDVESFNVLVEDLHESAKSIGLSERLIQSKVELQLRKNGLPVVDEETKSDSFGKPGEGCEYLYVNLNFGKTDSGYFAYNSYRRFAFRRISRYI